MLKQRLLDPDLMKANLEVSTKEEVLKTLANILFLNKYVKESYYDAVLEREKLFPTGLPTENIGVAIPHASENHAIKPGIAIAVLKKPVKFNVMGDLNTEIDIKVVFMIAITNPDDQIKLLQDLIGLVQNEEFLLNISNCKDVDSMRIITEKYVSNE